MGQAVPGYHQHARALHDCRRWFLNRTGRFEALEWVEIRFFCGRRPPRIPCDHNSMKRGTFLSNELNPYAEGAINWAVD